jgi:hypothetical protein
MLRAIEEFEPDVLLVEGAPETEELIQYLGDNKLKPPVAQLAYAEDDYRDSVFYPLAEFSPEWQAMTFAYKNNVPLKHIDLPLTHSLALARQKRVEAENSLRSDSETNPDHDDEEKVDSLEMNQDPLDYLAAAAGFSDGERWWEHVVEQHQHENEVFSAIADAMGAVRGVIEASESISHREALREAWMRKEIRKANKEGFEKIAVVCGAWHVPALIKKTKIKDDNLLLKGLPKVKLKVTWIPWSYGRISSQSGYGAGVKYPGWYHHIWKTLSEPNNTSLVASWLTMAARALRKQGFDVAPSSVIDAVRLADSLATLRGSPKPNIDDMNETIQTLFCFGEESPMLLLMEQMFIGERLGTVPDALPKAPLQQDLEKQIKTLRIKIEAVEKSIQLDLRKENGQQRSALFNRLIILNVRWAECHSSGSGKGTFKEIWQLQWQPECEIALIEKSAWGNSIETASARFALDQIKHSASLKDICIWIDRVLLADLGAVIPDAIMYLNNKAALVSNIDELMQSLPGLVRIVRYGDVRQTDTSSLSHVVDSFVSRICIGLVKHCLQIDHDSAKKVSSLLSEVTEALNILQVPEHLEQWFIALDKLTKVEDIHGLLAGRSYRLGVNADRIGHDEAAKAFGLALSQAEEPQHAADWIEGLLDGAATLLIHDDRIWSVLDAYLCQLDESLFQKYVPLLRRTFASFNIGERQNLIQKSKSKIDTQRLGLVNENEKEPLLRFNVERAEQSLPLLQTILGLE